MVRDKKQGYANQSNNNKSNKNIKKETTSNIKGKDQFYSKSTNQKDNTSKKSAYPPPKEYQLPSSKPKQSNSINSISQNTSNSANAQNSSLKKVQLPRPQQLQQAMQQLVALQGLLNSYDCLQMDTNTNIKSLVQSILQKQTRTQ